MDDLKPAILIMTKVPQPGIVKTRLRPFLSDDQCAELAVCFLRDAVAKAQRVTPKVIVAYSTIGNGAEIFDILPESIGCIRQTGNDLGERLAAAIDFAESDGCHPILIIGTDSPTLPPELLATSLQRLEESSTELVLGGTHDGGYYLIGVKQNIPSIFQGIPWSTDKVYSTTLDRANQIRLTGIVELPKWYDVDTPDDLRRLFAEINDNLGARATCPETSRWIDANQYLIGYPNRFPVLSADTIERAEMD